MANNIKQLNVVMLFDGTSNDNQDDEPTNVVDIEKGLIQDNDQIVIYRNGIGNDVEWNWLTRKFSQLTGIGGGWIMDGAYDQLLKKISASIANMVKDGDDLAETQINIKVSVGGFSRGAALARHFINAYIYAKLVADISKKSPNLNIELIPGCAMLFDTVPSFYIPINLWILENIFGIKNQEIDPGWDFSMKHGFKVRHALAIDERRNAFTPRLVDYANNNLAEEVWYSGDHSGGIGGGAKPDSKDAIRADDMPLVDMCRFAEANGLRFHESFRKKHQFEWYSERPLGRIHAPLHENYPSTQVGAREVYVLEKGKKSDCLPTISESTLIHMQRDESYRPANLLALKAFILEQFSGEKVQMTVEELKAYLDEPIEDALQVGATPLKFSPSLGAKADRKRFLTPRQTEQPTDPETATDHAPLRMAPSTG